MIDDRDNPLVSGSQRDGEDEFETSIRPQTFDDFVGQEHVKQNLRVFVEAAKRRGDALDHILLCGPPGLGKTTLSRILANELGVNILVTSGPVLEKKGDLAGNLTNLEERQVLFIDEIHRLNRAVEEALYPAMEDFVFDISIGEGPSARSVRLPLKKFTLVGATTRTGMLTSPLRGRFGHVERLNYYTPDDLCTIVLRAARILNVPCSKDAALELGKRARGTPRIANRLLRRSRDVAEVLGDGKITLEVVKKALTMLGVDDTGLDEMDRRILKSMLEHYNGGPVGLSTIAVVVGEEPDTIEEVYEPFLIQSGYLKRTPRGRELTMKAYTYFNVVPKKGSNLQADLFDSTGSSVPEEGEAP